MSTLKTKNIQHPSASGPAIALNPNGTFTAEIEDLSAESLHGGTFSLRNKLINGSFDIWQRGTTFSAAGYTADRWRGDATVAYTRVFGPEGLTYGMSISAGTTTIQQCVELALTGNGGEFYNGSTWTLSWYSTTDTFSPIVRFRDSGAPVANDVSVTVGPATAVTTVGSWTRYKAEVTIDQDPAATNTCLAVSLSTTGASSISGIQFEKGGLTALEVRPKGFELSLCHRYYQTFTMGAYGAGFAGAGRKSGSGYTEHDTIVPYGPMRATPVGEWTGTMNAFTLVRVSDGATAEPTQVTILGNQDGSRFTFQAYTSSFSTGDIVLQAASGSGNNQSYYISAEF